MKNLDIATINKGDFESYFQGLVRPSSDRAFILWMLNENGIELSFDFAYSNTPIEILKEATTKVYRGRLKAGDIFTTKGEDKTAYGFFLREADNIDTKFHCIEVYESNGVINVSQRVRLYETCDFWRVNEAEVVTKKGKKK